MQSFQKRVNEEAGSRNEITALQSKGLSSQRALSLSRSPHSAEVAHVNVKPRLHNSHQHVVRSAHVVIHRVPLLPRAFLGVRRRALLGKVDHLCVRKKSQKSVLYSRPPALRTHGIWTLPPFKDAHFSGS